MRGPERDWFEYRLVQVAGSRRVPRPFLPVVFESGARRIAASGLVDSGADASFIPHELARRLGLKPRFEGTEAVVFGDVVEVGTVRAAVRVPMSRGDLVVPGALLLVPKVRARVRVVVLGRSPLFEEARITFEDWRERFSVSRRRDPWWASRG